MATSKEVKAKDDWDIVDAYHFKFALSCQVSEDGQSTNLQVSFNLDSKSLAIESQEEAVLVQNAAIKIKELFCQSNTVLLPPKPSLEEKDDEKKISFVSEGVTHFLVETVPSAKQSASSAAENVNSQETRQSDQEGKKEFILVRVNYKNFEPGKSSPSIQKVWQDPAMQNPGT